MEMDIFCFAKTLKFFINDNDFDLYFKEIHFAPKYVFCASLYNTKTRGKASASIEIVDF